MINDEESDLTDIEDSDDEQPLAAQFATVVPPPQSLASKHATSLPPPPPQSKAKKKFKTGPRLDEPHLYAGTVETIYNELKNKIIDLDPEYQRSVVWDDIKQGYLIDSLMNNYVVFPLVFAERTDEDEGIIKVCIDGKQRITAIQRFKEGKIFYRDSQLNREMWYEKIPPGKKGVAFTVAQRQRFNNVTISICKYKEINEHDEREVFQRVQNGVALSTHERLKAVNGPNGDLVREMHKHTSIGLREFLGWKKAKGKEFFMLGQIAVIIKEILAKEKPPATQVSLTRVETFLNLKTAPTEELRTSALAVIQAINLIYDSPQLVDVFENIQSQFFVMAGTMIHLHRKTHSVSQLADAVRQMKKSVGPDTAAKLYKKLLTFVMDKVPSLRLKGQSLSTNTGCPASSAFPDSVSVSAVTRNSTPSSGTAPKHKQTVQKTPKRKREINDDDDGGYSAEASTYLTKRRRAPVLKHSDDEDDGDCAVISRDPPKVSATRLSIVDAVKGSAAPHLSTTKVSATRPSIADAAKASGSISKAQTRVRSKTTATTMSSSASRIVNGTQVARPSVKPGQSVSSRTKNPTTAGAIMSATRNKSNDSQQKVTPPALEKPMSTPPTSASSSLTPLPPPVVMSISAPIPKPPPLRIASPLFEDESRPSSAGCNTYRTGDSIHSAKSVPKNIIPAISHQTPPPASSGRLYPILRVKQMIQDQTSSQETMDPRPRSRPPSHHSQSSMPNDHEARFQFSIDQIGSILRSPATSTRPSVNPSNPPSPLQQQPRTSVAPLADVTTADDTSVNKSILFGVFPMRRRDDLVPARKTDKPSLQRKPVSHSIDTSSDPRSTSASTSTSMLTPGSLTNGNQNKPPPQPAPTVTAATLPEQKVPYRRMPPIKKVPSQPSPTIPARTSETQSGTRTTTSRKIWYESRRPHHPSPGCDRETSKR